MDLYDPKGNTKRNIGIYETEKGGAATIEEKAKVASVVTATFYSDFMNALKDPQGFAKEVEASLIALEDYLPVERKVIMEQLVKILTTAPKLTLDVPMLG